MPIALSHNADLGVRVTRMEGRLALSEIADLLALQQRDRALSAADSVQIVAQDIELSALTQEERDRLRAGFNTLHASLDIFVLRRSLWVCAGEAAYAMAQRWLEGRHTRDGQSTEARLVRALHEAGDMFTPQELALIRSGAGFSPIARFDAGHTKIPPPAHRR
ncbi:MAG TPA: hypothetical protein PLK37_10200 [Terricaulis sp.]|nr:hypothetical protein [Terricaulis sp.]